MRKNEVRFIPYFVNYYFGCFGHFAVQVFHDIAYKAKDRQDLLAGIDEFLDEVIVLPPGEWDPAIRIEPPKNLPPPDKRSPTPTQCFKL